MAEGIEITSPITEKGGTYPKLPKGKKTYGNQIININKIMREIDINFNKKE